MYHSGWAPCGTKVDTSSASRKARKARKVCLCPICNSRNSTSKVQELWIFNFLTSRLLNFSRLFLLQSTSFCPQIWAHRHLYLEIDDDVGAPLAALSLAPGRSDSSAFPGSSRVYTLHIHNEQYA